MSLIIPDKQNGLTFFTEFSIVNVCFGGLTVNFFGSEMFK